MEIFNIYCDESCHLPHDNSDIREKQLKKEYEAYMINNKKF